MNKEIIDSFYIVLRYQWWMVSQAMLCMHDRNGYKCQFETEAWWTVGYVNKTQRVNCLWLIESAEELFHQSIYPFVTSVAWLCVYQRHQRNMEEHHFNEWQQSIHKTRTKCFQRISFKGIWTDTYNTDSLGNLFYQCTSFESWMIIVWICWFTHNADSYSSG